MRRLVIAAATITIFVGINESAEAANTRKRVRVGTTGNEVTIRWTPRSRPGRNGENGTGSASTERGEVRTISKKTPRTLRPFVHRETCINTGGGTDPSSFWGCTNGNLRRNDGCATLTIGECRPGDTIPTRTTPPRKPEPNLGALVPPALAQVPLPEPMLSPPLEQPGKINLVGLPTFFAASNYEPITTTTTDGVYFLTLTATPRILTFDPADGHAPARCQGPGRRVRTRSQADLAKSQRCWHLYTDVPPNNADNYNTRLAIIWDLDYVTDVPPALIGGAIPPTLTTTTDIPVTIEQRQAVLVNPND